LSFAIDWKPNVAVLGDLHSAWNGADVAYFNASDYELILFTGDLGASGPRDGARIARALSGLQRPALVMPGNNDVAQYGELAAELTYRRAQVDLLSETFGGAATSDGRGQVRMCGLSAHRFELSDGPLTVIAGRPFAMGGNEASFPDALERSFGVRTLEASADKMRALVDEVRDGRLIFLAHNGPAGLGDEADAIWGRDFVAPPCDWGDTDLAAAIEHARARGRAPAAVIAGHMHWALRSGGARREQLERDGILYLNAARVPRIVQSGADMLHHHIALGFEDGKARVEQLLVAE
jgi:uncharacterized protein (TIGR04168 family)